MRNLKSQLTIKEIITTIYLYKILFVEVTAMQAIFFLVLTVTAVVIPMPALYHLHLIFYINSS